MGKEDDDYRVTKLVKPPRRDCPKCGDPAAFGFQRLQFQTLTYGNGTMRWECRTCGYTAFGKPLDEQGETTSGHV